MTPAPVVFLVDVDNTLLDNDRVQADLTVERIGDLLSHDFPKLLSLEVTR